MLKAIKKELDWFLSQVCKLFRQPAPKSAAPSKPTTPTKSSTNQSSEFIVYLTPSGSKYHYSRLCPALQHTKRQPIAMSYSKARAAGYTPCEKCRY
jgi:hypothetical protein